MTDLPEKVYVCFNENMDYYIAYTEPDDNDPEYIRGDLVPTWRTDMENAPRDGSVIGIEEKDGSRYMASYGLDVWVIRRGYNLLVVNPVKWLKIPK